MAIPDFQALAQPGVRGLRAYDPGHDLVALRRLAGAEGLLELGSNENAFGPSARVHDAIARELHRLHVYPDPLGGDLKAALSEQHGVRTTQIVLGNGSHELLMQLAQVFSGPGREVIASQYGFAVYALAAQSAGAVFTAVPAVPADADAQPRGHDLAGLAKAIGSTTALVYLANPNNPTGTWFSTEALRGFLIGIPGDVLVVVDEAYFEFVTDPVLTSAIGLLAEFPNLVVTRTFSKAYGLAGLRVGYLLAHPELAAVLERVRESFNVNAPGLAAAEAALADSDHLAWVREQTVQARDALRAHLLARGLRVASSQTNFLLIDFDQPAAAIEAALLARQVVPRPMAGYGLPTCLRVTVARPEESARFLQALDTIPI